MNFILFCALSLSLSLCALLFYRFICVSLLCVLSSCLLFLLSALCCSVSTVLLSLYFMVCVCCL